jgi:FkbM family methyltransferase
MISRIIGLVPEFVKSPIRRRLHDRCFWRSQAGQDFWVIGEVFNELRGGFFLDIGAHDGVSISNTYVLERRYAWKGICIEGNPTTFHQLKQNRTCDCVNTCLSDSEREVRFLKKGVLSGIVSEETDNRLGDVEHEVTVLARPLISILEECSAPKVIDYLSMDIEGAEEQVLKAFPFDRYSFNCITLERPSELLRHIITKAGYLLIKDIPGLDCFYVNNGFLEQYQKNIFSFYEKKVFFLNMG